MQRILHIVGKMDRAGAETMIMNLYRVIDRTQFQFDFVVFTDNPGDYDAEINSLGGKIFVLKGNSPISRMFALKTFLVKHPEYQILHSHTLFASAFHIFAACLAKVPFRISHAHSTNRTSSNKLASILYETICRKTINKFSTNFISCNKAAKNYLFPSKEDVLILPNSIDTSKFAEIGLNCKEYLNQEFDIDDSYLKIIQVGRLQKVKNHSFSIKIAEKLKEKNIPFRMFFIGQGELEVTIKKEVKEKDLIDEVILTGLRSDIPQLMAGADVMLMPSLHEGFPVVLVEAQSVGIPSLISDTISLEVDLNVELVEFVSLNANIDIWVEKLIKLKQKNRLEKELRLNRLAQKGFDIYTSTEILSKLYGSLIK
ncbi:glycosyltransferase [Aequorivita sinensis]|uniref:glycosyltransferase n=1 Tax=Aequorivita sinensis TaxID=1382458 RepID=UPI002301C06F|nr:glycosyltransferase [Aequorivita sinensis]